MDLRKELIRDCMGKVVRVVVDRPIGYLHHGKILYPINYGYLPGVIAGDGEEQDAYILGITEPIQTFDGQVIAVVCRSDDCEDKFVVAPVGDSYTKEEIKAAVEFQEKYFNSTIQTISDIKGEYIMKRVHDFLKKADVYYLATVEGDQPRVRPFGTVNEFEGKLYIQTGKVKPVSHQIAANPKAEICAFCEGAWIRIACELVEDDRLEPKKSMLDAYPMLRGMYDENDGNTQVFYMKDATATFCAFGKEPETVKF